MPNLQQIAYENSELEKFKALTEHIEFKKDGVDYRYVRGTIVVLQKTIGKRMVVKGLMQGDVPFEVTANQIMDGYDWLNSAEGLQDVQLLYILEGKSGGNSWLNKNQIEKMPPDVVDRWLSNGYIFFSEDGNYFRLGHWGQTLAYNTYLRRGHRLPSIIGYPYQDESGAFGDWVWLIMTYEEPKYRWHAESHPTDPTRQFVVLASSQQKAVNINNQVVFDWRDGHTVEISTADPSDVSARLSARLLSELREGVDADYVEKLADCLFSVAQAMKGNTADGSNTTETPE